MQSAVWECKQAPDTLLDWMQAQLVAAKGVTGARRQTPTVLEVTSESIPGWSIVLAIILFPIGLLALMAKNHHTLLLRAERIEAGGSRLYLDGNVSSGGMKRLVVSYRLLMETP
jgi:hypothetical protein